MRIHRNGITRAVLLIGPYAIKFPRWRYGWDKFLRGLLSNMTEARFNLMHAHFKLAPTIWAIPGGFMNVQRRCEPVTDEQWEELAGIDDCPFPPWNGMSCDFKRDNFGTLDGRIVLLDYGELT